MSLGLLLHFLSILFIPNYFEIAESLVAIFVSADCEIITNSSSLYMMHSRSFHEIAYPRMKNTRGWGQKDKPDPSGAHLKLFY